jgi:hypothetical protein
MATKVYPKYLQARQKGQETSDLSSAGTNVKAVLVDAGTYVYSDSHEFLSDIPSGARVGTSGNMTGKTVGAGGVFDCDDYSITVGASKPSAEALVYYIDTGVEGTSRIMCYIDAFTSGMPYTPPVGGGNVNITVDPAGVYAP